MTKEEKQLLLKDLCARLPYMPKIKIIYQQQGIKGTDEGNVSCYIIEHIVNDLRNGVITDMQIYLRPMSSMTEEEKKEYCDLQAKFLYSSRYPVTNAYELFDWLIAHHLDYRGLIPMGLALEAKEGMYKT